MTQTRKLINKYVPDVISDLTIQYLCYPYMLDPTYRIDNDTLIDFVQYGLYERCMDTHNPFLVFDKSYYYEYDSIMLRSLNEVKYNLLSISDRDEYKKIFWYEFSQKKPKVWLLNLMNMKHTICTNHTIAEIIQGIKPQNDNEITWYSENVRLHKLNNNQLQKWCNTLKWF